MADTPGPGVDAITCGSRSCSRCSRNRAAALDGATSTTPSRYTTRCGGWRSCTPQPPPQAACGRRCRSVFAAWCACLPFAFGWALWLTVKHIPDRKDRCERADLRRRGT